MNTLKSISFEKFRNYYLVALLCCLCIRNIGIYAFVPPIIDMCLFSALAFVGFFIFGVEVMNKDIKFNSAENMFLYGFILFFILSSIINMKYGFFQNIKECVWTLIAFFVVRDVKNIRGETDKLRRIVNIQNIIIVFWLVLSTLSVIMALLQIGHIFRIRENSWVGIGIAENRLFGAFVNPNSASVVAVIAILFSVFQIFNSLNGTLKAGINILNIVIQFIYISLSESRGSYMVLIFMGFCLTFLCCYNNFQFGKIKKLMFSVLTAVVSAFCVFVLLEFIARLFYMIPCFSEDIAILSSSGFCSHMSRRMDYVNNNDISNLRFNIWKSAWEIFKNNWLFGVTPGNVTNYAKSVMPDTFMAVRGYARAHSVWFGIPLYTGICGAICLFGFFLLCLSNFVNYYKRVKIKNAVPMCSLCFLIILGVWIYGLVESEILFVNSVCSFIFWFCLGTAKDYLNADRIYKR